MSHLIRTQIIEVNFAIQDEAFSLQQGLSDWYYQCVVPMLKKVFDDAAVDGEAIHLDRLEIDLGSIRLSEINTRELLQKFETNIRDQLLAVLHSGEREKSSKRAISLSVVDQWIFYMQHGYLSWRTAMADTTWYQLVLEGLATDSSCIDSLRRLIATDAKAVQRIVLLGSPEFLVHLTEVLTSEKQAVLPELMKLIRRTWAASGKGSEGIALTRGIWEELLRDASATSTLSPESTVQRELYAHGTEDDVIQLNQRFAQVPSLSNWTLKPKLTTEVASHETKLPARIQHQQDMPGEAKGGIPVEGIFVESAGLVLIHPFLNNLFIYLGLVKDGTFTTPNSLQKALAVLHFLATGNLTYDEHELVVPKILCNYPLEGLIDPDIRLSADEQQECDSLLREVIVRWAVLKNTSPDGLRANFLQRSGKFYTDAGEPHLLVETNVLDVLLDRLPWATGIIKLPWMTRLLKVEWR